jgi:hypothetical protein
MGIYGQFLGMGIAPDVIEAFIILTWSHDEIDLFCIFVIGFCRLWQRIWQR